MKVIGLKDVKCFLSGTILPVTEGGYFKEKQIGRLEQPIKPLTGWAAGRPHGKVVYKGPTDLLRSPPTSTGGK